MNIPRWSFFFSIISANGHAGIGDSGTFGSKERNVERIVENNRHPTWVDHDSLSHWDWNDNFLPPHIAVLQTMIIDPELMSHFVAWNAADMLSIGRVDCLRFGALDVLLSVRMDFDGGLLVKLRLVGLILSSSKRGLHIYHTLPSWARPTGSPRGIKIVNQNTPLPRSISIEGHERGHHYCSSQ